MAWSAGCVVYRWLHAVFLPAAQAKKRSVFTTWSNLLQIFPARALLNFNSGEMLLLMTVNLSVCVLQQRKLVCYFVSLLLRRRNWRRYYRTRHENEGTLTRSSQPQKWQFSDVLDTWKKVRHLLIIRNFSTDPNARVPEIEAWFIAQ